jgi:hypothetical protein
MYDFHAWRRRALLLPALAALALACATVASAATPPAGAVDSSNRTAQFTGTLTMTNFLPPDATTGSPCPDQTTDPVDAVCGHFHLTTQVAGAVQTCVSFTPPATDMFGMTDLDVYVIDETTGSSTFETIISSSATDANPECVTFAGVASGEYEIQVNPSLVSGPTDYTGNVVFTPNGTTAKTASTAGPEMEGNGQLADLTQFTEALTVLEPNENKLKVKSHDGGACAFKANGSAIVVDSSAQTTSTDGKKLNGDMSAHGSGTNFGRPVTFTVQVHDGGNSDGSGDSFTFSTNDGCSVSGSLIKGHVEYEISK